MSTSVGTESPLVSVLIVTYRPDLALLTECLLAVKQQAYRPLEVVVVDNGSRDDRLTGAVAAVGPPRTPGLEFSVALHCLARNSGFAHATNVAVQRSGGSLCLILNPDAVLEGGAIAALVTAAQENPHAIGFAPKVKLYRHADVIDSVGIGFSWSGDAFQRGLGEVDLGQFERPGPIPGVTMGAALVRREGFDPERVGPLDDRFFMFYEDVDWSLRAALQGEVFVSVPGAVVRHVGSHTVRRRSFAWRYGLIERNVYYMAIKNYEQRHLFGFLLQRTRAHRNNVLQGRHVVPTLAALAGGGYGLFRMHDDRRSLQARRRLADRDVIVRSMPSGRGMNYVTWTPAFAWPMVRASLGRLFAVSGDDRWDRAGRHLDGLLDNEIVLPRDEILERLAKEVGTLPQALINYALAIPDDHRSTIRQRP